MFLLNEKICKFDYRNLKFTIQNVPIKFTTTIATITTKINLQYKMFLLNLSSSNYQYSIPLFLIFVDTNIFIYFYQEFLFIFL